MHNNIEAYIEKELLTQLSITSIRELVLFLQLAKHKEFTELSTELESIEDIPGLKNIVRSASTLHRVFGRRHALINRINIFRRIYNALFIYSFKFNPDDIDQRLTLFKHMDQVLSTYIQENKTLLDLELVKHHENILAKLLYKSSIYKKNRELTDDEIDKTLAKFKLEHDLLNKLRSEYIQNSKRLKQLFIDNLSEGEIKSSKRNLKDLTLINIGQVLNEFSTSRLASYGIYYRISPEAKLAIETYIISFILTNTMVTVLATYVIPHILILNSAAISGIILYGSVNLLPIIIPILVNKYYHSHYHQAAETRKHKLVHQLNQNAKIFEYRERLKNSGFNLADNQFQSVGSIKESLISAGIFANPQNNPSEQLTPVKLVTEANLHLAQREPILQN